MMKHFLRSCLAASVILFFAAAANAATLNITLGDDIKSHKDSLVIDYAFYYTSGPGPHDIEGISSSASFASDLLSGFLETFNQAIAGKHLIDNTDGKHSQITLGYMKDGHVVSPCQAIPLKDATNILLTESKCEVQ